VPISEIELEAAVRKNTLAAEEYKFQIGPPYAGPTDPRFAQDIVILQEQSGYPLQFGPGVVDDRVAERLKKLEGYRGVPGTSSHLLRLGQGVHFSKGGGLLSWKTVMLGSAAIGAVVWWRRKQKGKETPVIEETPEAAVEYTQDPVAYAEEVFASYRWPAVQADFAAMAAGGAEELRAQYPGKPVSWFQAVNAELRDLEEIRGREYEAARLLAQAKREAQEAEDAEKAQTQEAEPVRSNEDEEETDAVGEFEDLLLDEYDSTEV
jgi:hypothetical protein